MSREEKRIHVSIHKKLSNLSNTTSNEQCIFRVHDELQSQNKQAYEPRVISIGPYHHGKRNLERMEMFKVKHLQDLLDRGKKENVERYIDALTEDKDRALACYVEKIIDALTEDKDRALACYAEKISLNDDEFVDMLFLDGCFVVEFLRSCHKRTCTWDESIFQKGWLVNIIYRDLLLVENQIPFFIVDKLFEMTKAPDEKDDIIKLGLHLCCLIKGFSPTTDYATEISADDVSHLLDLVHKGWCSPFAATLPKINDSGDDLSLESMKSTTELQEGGVKIRRATDYESWLHITFEDGIIKVPPLTIDDFTETILRNLIAHELYMSNLYSRCYVADYVKFLDHLIDSPRDVRKLRRHGIILNRFGDDEVVSTMFKKLLRDITVNDWMFCYSKIFMDVNEYSRGRWHRLRAYCVINWDQLMKTYFSSPWSFISCLAGAVLLMLTVVQTISPFLSINRGR